MRCPSEDFIIDAIFEDDDNDRGWTGIMGLVYVYSEGKSITISLEEAKGKFSTYFRSYLGYEFKLPALYLWLEWEEMDDVKEKIQNEVTRLCLESVASE